MENSKMSNLLPSEQRLADALAKMTPAPWLIEVDGWPVWVPTDKPSGTLPYWAETTDESKENPYAPYRISFDTLNGMTLLRNEAPALLELVSRMRGLLRERMAHCPCKYVVQRDGHELCLICRQTQELLEEPK